jgi:hypothetical protein
MRTTALPERDIVFVLDLLFCCGFRVSRPVSQCVCRAVYRDAAQPESCVLLAREFFCRAKKIEKHVLRNLFGQAVVARKAQRYGENHPLMGFYHPPQFGCIYCHPPLIYLYAKPTHLECTKFAEAVYCDRYEQYPNE